MGRLLILALLCSPASAGDLRLPTGFEAEMLRWGGSAGEPPPPIGAKAALRRPEWASQTRTDDPAVVALEPLLDSLWRKGVIFQAGSLTIHLCGMKSANRGKNWFLTFYEEGREEPRFLLGRRLIRYRPFFSPLPVLNGSEVLEVDGRRFVVYIQGQISNRGDSRLRVELEGSPELRLEWKLRQVADAAFESGYPLRLGGRDFRLLYTRDILEDGEGRFAGFAPARTLLFMTREGGQYTAYAFDEAELPGDEVRFFSKSPAGEESAPARALRVGLRLRDGSLEVYGAQAR